MLTSLGISLGFSAHLGSTSVSLMKHDPKINEDKKVNANTTMILTSIKKQLTENYIIVVCWYLHDINYIKIERATSLLFTSIEKEWVMYGMESTEFLWQKFYSSKKSQYISNHTEFRQNTISLRNSQVVENFWRFVLAEISSSMKWCLTFLNFNYRWSS